MTATRFAPALIAALAYQTTAWAAPQPRPLTLREAIALAVKQNPALASARVDVAIAAAASESAKGLDDLTVVANAGLRDDHNAVVTGVPIQQAAASSEVGELSLTQPLRSGGQIGLDLRGSRSYTRQTLQIDPSNNVSTDIASKSYASFFGLKLEHPLLRGFGSSVARADQRRARVHEDIAAAQEEGAATALVRDVVATYWELAFATEELAIRRAAAASARDQLSRVEANIAVGKQPRSASAEVEVAVAVRDAAALAVEANLLRRGLELSQLCGLSIEATDHPTLAASDRPVPPAQAPDGQATLETAMAQNPQLAAVRALGRSAAIDVEVTKNGLLPQLDLTVLGGPTSLSTTIHQSYSQLTELKTYTVEADLTFQQPLARHAARGANEAAREGMMKVRLSEANLTAQVAVAVARGLAVVSVAHRQEEVLARSVSAAMTDLEAERARFEAGRSTSFDVLRRQESLADVQLALLRANVDHLEALASVQAATGEILAVNGVSLRWASP